MANPAPGDLETVRGFVNSVEIDQTSDPLGDKDALAEWCTQTGLLPDPEPASLADLRRFRETLRAVLEANAGEGEAAEAWRAMQPYAARACFELWITPDSVPALRPKGAGADMVISAVLAIAYDAIACGAWSRLKACRKHSCRWAFYDNSKNGSGAWCNMRVCGNRAKAERRRAREKSHESR